MYQFCLIDPEGDYENFGTTVVLGDAHTTVNTMELLNVLSNRTNNAIVNLLGIQLEDRPNFFSRLLPSLQHMRISCARPHWIIVDEAHHMLPKHWKPAPEIIPTEMNSMLFITVHPETVSKEILRHVDIVVAVSDNPADTLNAFAERAKVDPPKAKNIQLDKGQALVWFVKDGKKPKLVNMRKSTVERRRHRRKYAEGELSRDTSFYFSRAGKSIEFASPESDNVLSNC